MLVTAFGRTLTARKWAEEPVCAVTVRALERRLKAGWNPETAITKPAFRELEPAPQLVKWKGVDYQAAKRRYRAMIKVSGKLKRLGLFLIPEEAARAYNRALAALNDPDRRGFNILEPRF